MFTRIMGKNYRGFRIWRVFPSFIFQVVTATFHFNTTQRTPIKRGKSFQASQSTVEKTNNKTITKWRDVPPLGSVRVAHSAHVVSKLWLHFLTRTFFLLLPLHHNGPQIFLRTRVQRSRFTLMRSLCLTLA